MEILGIGPLELLFIMVIALLVLGPNDMVKAGRTMGRWLRALITSPTWRTIQEASRELQRLPNKLMREAGIEDLKKELPTAESLRKGTGIDEVKAALRSDLESVNADMRHATSDNTIAPPAGLPSASAEGEQAAGSTRR